MFDQTDMSLVLFVFAFHQVHPIYTGNVYSNAFIIIRLLVKLPDTSNILLPILTRQLP